MGQYSRAPSTDLVAIPHLGTRHDVRRRVVGPLVVGDAGVVGPVDARDLHEWVRVAAAGPLNLELRAGDVELRPVDVALVQTDMLDTHQILAGRSLGRDGKLEPVLVVRAPVGVDVATTAAETGLVNLEPVPAAVIVVDAARGFGHVDEAGTRVLDDLVVEDLEADPVAGPDGGGLGVARSGTHVATHVVGVEDVGEHGEVRVGVAPHVGVLAAHALAVDVQDVEDVVRIRRGQGGRNGGEG
jgi:hypothetical protein